MPRSTTKTKKAPPRPPSLDSARRLYLAAWVNPTEDGLQQARRSLVRRMWQARRACAPTHRQALHDLYTRICAMQVRQEWNITPAERASRNRNLNDPHQYEREQRQRLGEPAFLHTSQPDREAHAYAPTAMPVESGPVIVHQGVGQVDTPPLLTAKYRNRRAQSLHRFAVHHLARVLYLAHYRGWGGLNLTPSYSPPSGNPRPASGGAVRFSGTLWIEGVVIQVDTLITTAEYQQALSRLTVGQQSEIQSYYRRSPAKNDLAPEIENWSYQNTVQAFDALLHALYDQGSLKR